MIKDKSINKYRIEWIDIFKGLAMLMIVLQHSSILNVTPVSDIISLIKLMLVEPFATPLFFVLNGYLFNYQTAGKLSFKDFIRKKYESMIIPYIIMSIILIPVHIMYNIYKHNEISLSLYYLYDLIAFCRFSLPLWFLMALFFSNILFYILIKLAKLINMYIKNLYLILLLLFIVIVSLASILSKHGISFIPFRFDVVMISTCLMVIGQFIRNTRLITLNSTISKKNVIVVCISFLVSMFLIWINNKDFIVSLYLNKLPKHICLYIFENIFKFVFMCILCKALYNLFVMSRIQLIGEYSIYIMGFHVWIIVVCDKVLSFLNLNQYMFKIIKISIIFILIYIFSCIINCLRGRLLDEKFRFKRIK